MSLSNAKNIIELRQLLAEKFPGLRLAAGKKETLVDRWPSGVAQLDAALDGGFPKSALTELTTSRLGSGSALLITTFIRQASRNHQWIALIDAQDTFDPAALDNNDLARLLWVRCSAAKQALQAADLLLHAGTTPVLLLDLVSCPSRQLRKIPSSTWYRFERTVQSTPTVCLILTPEPIITPAQTRLLLQTRFHLDALQAEQQTLLSRIAAIPLESSSRSHRFVQSA